MSKLYINAVSLAVTLAFSAGAMAEGMSKADYKAGMAKISSEYKTDKASCSAYSGNASDVCKVMAKSKEKVAAAELEANYQPTSKHRYEARIAKAEGDYAVAKEKCDDLSGNAKDVCVKEAKAAETTAIADAKTQLKTTDANATANEKTADARDDANKKTMDARKDATADKVDAQYAVAKEKCDTYSGTAKDSCMSQAKAQFGK